MLKMEKSENKMKEKNTERIDNDIIRDVREYLGVEPDNTSKDDEIDRMSPNEIFDKWCEWNGYIRLSEIFRRVMGSIYGINIERRVILR